MWNSLLKFIVRATKVYNPEGITINLSGETTLLTKIIEGDHRVGNLWISLIGPTGGINNHFMIHQISHTFRMEYIDKDNSPAGSLIPIIVPQTHKGGEPKSQKIKNSKMLLKRIHSLITSVQNRLKVL